MGKYVIAEIRYHGCTNYEGHKILVFDSLTEEQIKLMPILDPHFSKDSPHLSPIARFVPTEKGWDMAILFAIGMSATDKAEEK